jgi:hypothetical protein
MLSKHLGESFFYPKLKTFLNQIELDLYLLN